MEIPKDILYPKINKPSCQVFLVGGPPGSGKSTFVKANAKPNDIIIDLDEIMSKLSGLPIYQANHDEWIIKSLKERNRILDSLSTVDKSITAWVIVSASGFQWQWWRINLRAPKIHSCWCPMEVCISKIKNDRRRLHDLARHISACIGWFINEEKAMKLILKTSSYDK